MRPEFEGRSMGLEFGARGTVPEDSCAVGDPSFPAWPLAELPGEARAASYGFGVGARAGDAARERRAGSRLLISLEKTTCIRSGPNRGVAAQKGAISPEPRTAPLTSGDGVSLPAES